MTTGRINQVTVRRTTEEASPPSDSDLPRPGLFRREGYRRPANGTPERFPSCTRIDRLPLGKPVDPSTAFPPSLQSLSDEQESPRWGATRGYYTTAGDTRPSTVRSVGAANATRDRGTRTEWIRDGTHLPHEGEGRTTRRRERNSPAESREHRDDRPRSGA